MIYGKNDLLLKVSFRSCLLGKSECKEFELSSLGALEN